MSRVHAFPLHRHARLVDGLARRMADAGPNGARDFLIEHLGFEWDRLENYGVECEEIEIRIDELARALWAAAYQNSSHPGAA